MKKNKILIMGLCAALSVSFLGCKLCAATPDNISSNNGIRIASWNMRWFPTGYPTFNPLTESEEKVFLPEFNGKKTKKLTEKQLDRINTRIDEIAAFIKEEEADIIMLQEVRSGEILNRLTGHKNIGKKWCINVCTEFTTSTNAAVPAHQNAIISRFKAVDAGWREWKDENGIKPPRGFVWAVFECDSALIATIGVHLKSNYIDQKEPDKEEIAKNNRALRELSAKQLNDFTQELKSRDYSGRKITDVIIGGDFNTSVFDKNYDGEKTIPTLLESGFKDCFEGVVHRNTMNATKKYPATCFDYLLHLGQAETFSPVVSKKHFTSDHKMISVIIRAE